MLTTQTRLRLAVLSFGMLSACGFFRPHGNVTNITRQEHPAFINGEMDWGSEVGFDVNNDGASGIVHVNVTLSSSEGQWVRSQDLMIESGQFRHLTYFFQEPTINATNLQAIVRVDP